MKRTFSRGVFGHCAFKNISLPRAGGGPCSFAVGQKNQNPTAACGAMEATAEAWTVVTAPPEAEEKVNGGSVVWLKKRTYRLAGFEGLACGKLENDKWIIGKYGVCAW